MGWKEGMIGATDLAKVEPVATASASTLTGIR